MCCTNFIRGFSTTVLHVRVWMESRLKRENKNGIQRNRNLFVFVLFLDNKETFSTLNKTNYNNIITLAIDKQHLGKIQAIQNKKVVTEVIINV